jgi:hypothetical protein
VVFSGSDKEEVTMQNDLIEQVRRDLAIMNDTTNSPEERALAQMRIREAWEDMAKALLAVDEVCKRMTEFVNHDSHLGSGWTPEQYAAAQGATKHWLDELRAIERAGK